MAGKRFSELLHHLNVRGFKRVSHERQGLFDDAVYIDVPCFRSAGPRKIEQIVDDFAGAECCLTIFQ